MVCVYAIHELHMEETNHVEKKTSKQDNACVCVYVCVCVCVHA